jgi:hypothetical protein
VLAGLLVANGLVRAGAQEAPPGAPPEEAEAPPELAAQAEELAALCRKCLDASASTAILNAEWSVEAKEYAAESVRLAVLGATTEPLSDEVLEALRAVVTRYVEEGIAWLSTAEGLELQRETWAWYVRDILTTPPPTEEEAAALRSQFTELLELLGAHMRDDLELPDLVVDEALAYGRQRWIEDHIGQPSYRFDRKPLTPEAMERARQLVLARVETLRAKLPRWSAMGLSPDKHDEMRLMEAKSAAHGALFSVVKQECGWRTPPPPDPEKQRRASLAGRAAVEAWMASLSLRRLRLLLGGVLVGAEAVGNPVALPQ